MATTPGDNRAMSSIDGARSPADRGRVELTLLVRGEVEPEFLTTALGLQPSVTYRRGQPVSGTPSRPGRPRTDNGWLLHSDPVAPADLQPHLDWMLERIEPRAGILTAIRAIGATVSLRCVWTTTHAGDGPVLSPEAMARLGALGIPLAVTLHRTDGARPI